MNRKDLYPIDEAISKIMSCNELHESVDYLRNLKGFTAQIKDLSLEEEFLFLCLEFLGMDQTCDLLINSSKRKEIFSDLRQVQEFYKEIGGILGYQKLIFENLFQAQTDHFQYFPPQVINIQEKTDFVKEGIEKGLETLAGCCEIYVVGGAADRLGFFDQNNEPLPAASYYFLGKPLLQHLIDDLEARECLYFQKYGKKLQTPICLMTSDEKKNNQRIQKLLEENNYFGRRKDSFYFIRQPMVPTVDQNGKWVLDEELILKPSGHGALWLSAIQQGVISQIKALGYKYALVRQINNPIIGMDYNLLAFIGVGAKLAKKFGFFVTQRMPGQPEGVVAQINSHNSKIITNVEYCTVESAKLTGNFPSNTNLLFVELEAIEQAAKEIPYPGCLLNFKSSKQGNAQARLELTMQNIAEFFKDQNLDFEKPHESVFLVSQKRNKAISTIKKLQNHESQLETPERAFYDISAQIHELLKNLCRFDIPEFYSSFENFIKCPTYLFIFHPALGPEFETISKKLSYWKLSPQSFVNLHISQIEAFNIQISGGLVLEAEDLYSSSCEIKNLVVRNEGGNLSNLDLRTLDYPAKNKALRLKIGKNSHLVISDSILEGSGLIVIPDNTIAYLISNQLVMKCKQSL